MTEAHRRTISCDAIGCSVRESTPIGPLFSEEETTPKLPWRRVRLGESILSGPAFDILSPARRLVLCANCSAEFDALLEEFAVSEEEPS
jgi:hypothetical protein